MTDLRDAIGDALDSAYRGSRTFVPVPGAEQLSPAALLRELRAGYGSLNAAAREAGIDRRTFQRAVNRETPYKPTARVLEQLRAAYVPIAHKREAEQRERLRNAQASVYATMTAHKTGTLTITGKVIVSGDVRTRELKLGRVFSGRTKRAVVDAYLAGDLDRAAHEFNVGISADYLENPRPSARDMYVDSVHTLKWS